MVVAVVKLPVGEVPSEGGGRLLVAEGSRGSTLMRFPKEPTRPARRALALALLGTGGEEEKEQRGAAVAAALAPTPPLALSLPLSILSPPPGSELWPLLPRLPRPRSDGTLRSSCAAREVEEVVEAGPGGGGAEGESPEAEGGGDGEGEEAAAAAARRLPPPPPPPPPRPLLSLLFLRPTAASAETALAVSLFPVRNRDGGGARGGGAPEEEEA